MFSSEYSYVRFETIDAYAEPAFSLFGELLLRPRFDDDAFAAAKSAAVQRAKRDLEAPAASADRLFFTAMDPRHPRSRAVDGDPSALGALTLVAARRHHAVMVASPNVILAVSSNLPVARVESLVNAAFPLGPPAVPSPALSMAAHEPPLLPPGRRETLVETGREQSSIVIGAPVGAPDKDAAALRVACLILSERLADRLREREGLAYSIGASLRLDSPGRAVTMSAGTRPENLARIEQGMREVAADLRTTLTTKEMIAGALNRAEGQTRMRRLTRIGQAYALAMAELRGRDPEQLDADVPTLRAVVPEDVQRAAVHWLTFDPSIAAIAR